MPRRSDAPTSQATRSGNTRMSSPPEVRSWPPPARKGSGARRAVLVAGQLRPELRSRRGEPKR
eukprot:7186363-Alexandrium_andersonii.AAC.1